MKKEIIEQRIKAKLRKKMFCGNRYVVERRGNLEILSICGNPNPCPNCKNKTEGERR
jgi:hypothetical protein